MSRNDSINPYDPPSPDIQKPQKDNSEISEFVFPVEINADRDPLIEPENRCLTFQVERSPIESANLAKLAILPHIVTVLNCPSAIFQGLKRSNFENGFAYSGLGTVDFPKQFVFLVFVEYDEDVNKFFVLDWERRKHSDVFSGHPEGWQEDFETRLWPPFLVET